MEPCQHNIECLWRQFVSEEMKRNKESLPRLSCGIERRFKPAKVTFAIFCLQVYQFEGDSTGFLVNIDSRMDAMITPTDSNSFGLKEHKGLRTR